jgi:ABC-type branched-subunit amino acid transport system ATPase component
MYGSLPKEDRVALVEVENLSKTYGGAHAVDSVGFEIQQGKSLGCGGPTGQANRRPST